MKSKTGERIREIRKYLGLTRPAFAIWLQNHGTEGREKDTEDGKKYSVRSIEGWETGVRTPPPKVLRTIVDNVLYEGEKINWSYLTGDSDFIANSSVGIAHYAVKQLAKLKQDTTEWHPVSKDEFSEILQSPSNKFANALFDDILPFYGHDINDIFDVARFYKYMESNIGSLVSIYIEHENDGR